MHTKMKGEGIKGLFIEQIVPVMERHGYHFMKAKNVFVYEDREWKNECILRFTNWENDQLSLRTEYFVTCKKVSQLYKEAISEKDCMPICGVLDVGWAYKYLGIPLDDKSKTSFTCAEMDRGIRERGTFFFQGNERL